MPHLNIRVLSRAEPKLEVPQRLQAVAGLQHTAGCSASLMFQHVGLECIRAMGDALVGAKHPV